MNAFFGFILKDIEKNVDGITASFAEKELARRMGLRYGFIFSQYDPRKIPISIPRLDIDIFVSLNQWELVENMKKFLAVVAAVFVSRSGVGQSLMMIAVIWIALWLQLRFEPMNERPRP